MKIELYHHDVISALQKHINEKLNINLDLDKFEGDKITEIKLVSDGEVEQHAFREGDSIIFYLS